MSVVTHTYRFTQPGSDFGRRKGSGLVILHTFENSDPTKNTVVDALAGARWQDGRPGSYNRLVAVDGVVSCVPDTNISGGVNPASAYFQPRAWLYQKLPATKVNDPNSYALQLCTMGRRAYYDQYGWPPGIIDGFARSIVEEIDRVGPVVVANHADFQPGNRTDAGAVAIDLVMKRIQELTAPEEDMAYAWVANIKPFADGKGPRWITFRIGTSYREQPDLSAASKPRKYDVTFRRLVLGTVEGEDFGQGPLWYPYQTSAGRLGVAHTQDEIKELTEPMCPEGSTQDNAFGFAVQREAVGLLGELANQAGTLKGSIEAAATQVGSKKP